jgi:hypothetical protein
MIWELGAEGEVMTETTATPSPQPVLDRVFGLSKSGSSVNKGSGSI